MYSMRLRHLQFMALYNMQCTKHNMTLSSRGGVLENSLFNLFFGYLSSFDLVSASANVVGILRTPVTLC